MLKRFLTVILGGGLLLGLGGLPAQADVVVQTFSLPLTQTNWDPSTFASGENPFIVQQFDAAAHMYNGAPGVLSSVQLKMDYEFDNTLHIVFANPATIIETAHGDISLNVTGVTSLTGFYDRTGQSTATGSDTFPKTVDFANDVKTDSRTATYTDVSTLSKFLGTGTISVPAIATAQSTTSSTSGNGFGSSRMLAAVHFTVTYSFVPEPASFALMGLGLGSAGLVLVRQRRAATA